MKFFVLADEDIVLGFRYVGVEGEIVSDPEEAKEAFERALKIPNIGILIITEKIMHVLHEDVLKWQLESSYPLIVEIPDLSGHLEDRKTLSDAIREAVGISI